MEKVVSASHSSQAHDIVLAGRFDRVFRSARMQTEPNCYIRFKISGNAGSFGRTDRTRHSSSRFGTSAIWWQKCYHISGRIRCCHRRKQTLKDLQESASWLAMENISSVKVSRDCSVGDGDESIRQ